jgi:hypothetical protein
MLEWEKQRGRELEDKELEEKETEESLGLNFQEEVFQSNLLAPRPSVSATMS